MIVADLDIQRGYHSQNQQAQRSRKQQLARPSRSHGHFHDAIDKWLDSPGQIHVAVKITGMPRRRKVAHQDRLEEKDHEQAGAQPYRTGAGN